MTLPDRLAHLPNRKRRELERAAQILFDEFEDAIKTKRGRILKLILFGSYARGDWVEDRKSGYLSDYDLLVIVNEERFAEQYEAWEKAGERSTWRNGISTSGFRTPPVASSWRRKPFGADMTRKPRSISTRRPNTSIIACCSSWRSTARNLTS